MRPLLSLCLFLPISLTACGPARPPWADGAVIRTEVPANARPQDLSNLRARLLALHNRERAGVRVPALSWDTDLEAAAAAYGPQLERLGQLAHSPAESRPGQGENLWMGTAGAFSPEEMVGGWIGEKSLFRPGLFPDVSTSGHYADVGHYTQIIWRGTTRVGCALHRSTRHDILICRYSPPGNVLGDPVP